MKRVVLAAIFFAAAGAMIFDAPALAAGYQGAMTGTGPYAFTGGQCQGAQGNGDFCIKVGDSVEWKNQTTAPHTVTGDSFGSKNNIGPGSSYSYTFTSTGTFPYHCELHRNMTGTVNVTEATPASSSSTTQATTPTTRAATTTTKQTTTSTTGGTTTTTSDDLNGIFDPTETSVEPTTTIFSTDTTRALGESNDKGTSAGAVAALVLGLGAIGTAAALVVRRMRGGGITPP